MTHTKARLMDGMIDLGCPASTASPVPSVPCCPSLPRHANEVILTVPLPERLRCAEPVFPISVYPYAYVNCPMLTHSWYACGEPESHGHDHE